MAQRLGNLREPLPGRLRGAARRREVPLSGLGTLRLLLRRLGLLLAGLRGPDRSEWRREADKGQEDEDRKEQVEERLLPVQVDPHRLQLWA